MDRKLFDDLKKFGHDVDLNIFEFLKKFEAYTEEQGSATDRAILLYEQYLDKEVQLELVDKASNYKLMRHWLIKKFGDIKVICDNIVKSIAKERMPGDSASHQTLTVYYRKLNSVIKKLQELSKTVDLPQSELEAHIYSSEFLAKLLKFVPRRTKLEFMEKLMYSGEDVHRVKGKGAFSVLSTVVFCHFTSHSAASSDEEPQDKPHKERPVHKKKSVHAVKVLEDSSEESDNSASYQGSRKKKLKYPCCLVDHDHEIGKCPEFFKLTPTERFDKKDEGLQICHTCFGPRELCMKICKNMKKLPEKLICWDCKRWADKHGRSPLNILYCKREEHKKPDNKTILESLRSWLPGFDPNKHQGAIEVAA